MLLDTPLKTKTLFFFASAEWYDLGSDILTFFPKTCCIFGSLCRMAKSFPQKIINIHLYISYIKAFIRSIVWPWWPPNDIYFNDESPHWKTVLFVETTKFSFQIVSEFIDISVKFSNFMSRGWGFWLPVLSRGECFCTQWLSKNVTNVEYLSEIDSRDIPFQSLQRFFCTGFYKTALFRTIWAEGPQFHHANPISIFSRKF